MPIDIGLIGATAIAERAIVRPSTDREDVRVRAVAASDPDRASAFAARNGISRVHRDYAALLADPDIDTVYISLHNSAHFPWAVRALCSGRHVVVEKPLCLRAQEAHELRRAAAACGRQAIEALPTVGHPWQAEVRNMIAQGTWGRLRSVHTRVRFGAPAADSYKNRPDLGGGIFRDCASYWLQALQATVGLKGAFGRGRSAFDGPNGVDRAFDARVEWPGGPHAVLECDAGGRPAADHVFVFDGAEARLKNFLLPVVGALPLNLAVVRPDGRRQVMAFPAWSYYDHQLDRIRARLAPDASGAGAAEAPAGCGADPAGARVELMERLYLSARHGS